MFLIVSDNLLTQYQSNIDNTIGQKFDYLHDSELSTEIFDFYTSVSAVFSSKIEGENIELDSFVKHKRFNTKYQPDYTRKTDDLYEAYLFAQQTKLSVSSLMEAHAKLTQHILQKSQRGKIRSGNMFVITESGKIEYVAVSPDKVESEMQKYYADIETLLLAQLSFEEILYYASMLHLVFVKIHPFYDGNGRTARLLEKWFISKKLGPKAWFIQSEKYYYEQHQSYYNNIRCLDTEYEDLDYSKALPFLQMLPNAIV